MSTSKRFGRLAQPIIKGGRTEDFAAKRRKAQKKRAAARYKPGRWVA